jgi:beta-lactamase regulating signal transducer with metallopeptidase domain
MLAIGKYILASAVLLVFYRLFLRKHASFRESRLFLLSVAFLALAVSQFRIEVTHPAPTILEVEREMPAAQQVSLLTDAGGLSVPQQTETAAITKAVDAAVKPEPSPIQQAFTWIRSHILLLVLSLYIMVVLILVLNLLLQYRSIRKLRRTGMGSLHEGYTLVEHPEVSTPFSFATTIFLPTNLNAGQRDIVETHERWHIRHKHYVDVLVQEITCCLFWFNPIQWLLRKDLRSVHEYQADRSVLNEGCDVYRYQTVILEEVLGHHFRLANGFNQSFTKKRFIQMKQFEPLRLNTLRKVASVCCFVLLFAALSVVPGKSQVIRVERSSTTSRTENGTTTAVTFRSVDTLSNNLLSSSISIDPDASPSQLQQSYSLSLDSQQRIINRVLPLVRKLARSPHPADDVKDINALLEALNIKVNNQSADYTAFSPEFKKSLTKDDFQGFEKTLINMNDSIKLYRTYKIDRIDSPYALKQLALPQMILTDNLMKKLITESFGQLFRSLGATMDGMGNAMTSLEGSTGSKDGAEAFDGMGEAIGEMGKVMTGMLSSMASAIPTQNQAVGQPNRTATTQKPTMRSSGNVAQPTTRSSGNFAQRPVQVRSTTDKERDARLQAVIQMTDQSALINIAKNDDDPDIRKTAVRKMTDQDAIAHIARTDDDKNVRMEAVIRMTDQNALAYIARTDDESFIRKRIVQKITDQDAIAYIARTDGDMNVRMEAVIRMTDQDALAYIARTEDEPFIRKRIVQKMTDQDAIAYIARTDDDEDVRIEAVNRMTDQDALAYIARTDDKVSVRQMAIRKLTDKATLEYIAKNDKDKDVCMAAFSRLGKLSKQ